MTPTHFSVFEKLGVETRTAAANLAMARMGMGRGE
jgi:hypothetical protein